MTTTERPVQTPAGVIVTAPDCDLQVVSNGDGTYSVVGFKPADVSIVAPDPTSYHCRQLRGLEGSEKFEAQRRIAVANEAIEDEYYPDESDSGYGEVFYNFKTVRSTEAVVSKLRQEHGSFTVADLERGLNFADGGYSVSFTGDLMETACENADLADEVNDNINWGDQDVSAFVFDGSGYFIHPALTARAQEQSQEELWTLEGIWFNGGNN